MKIPKKQLDPWLYTILTKRDKLWRHEKTKGKRAWARGVKLWESEQEIRAGGLMEHKGYF